MKRAYPLWAKRTAALVCVLGMAACSLLRMPPAQSPPLLATTAATPARHIVQLDFGREARYARCSEPACPATTPKTLATVATAAARVPVVETTSIVTHTVEVTKAPTPTTPVAPSALTASTSKAQVLVLHFNSDSATLTPTHKAMLASTVVALSQAERLIILGRTDDVGANGPNQTIALARAVAVRDHLRHIAPSLPDDIRVDAKGLCCYAAPNNSVEGRAQNRRVELVFSVAHEVKP